MLLLSVIPLSFEHFPFFPFPLYMLIMLPFFHSSGISWWWAVLFSIVLYISMDLFVALVKISFGISSGPVAFLFCSFFWAFFISCVVISSMFWCFSVSAVSLTAFVILFVHAWYSGLPSLAWYSSS